MIIGSRSRRSYDASSTRRVLGSARRIMHEAEAIEAHLARAPDSRGTTAPQSAVEAMKLAAAFQREIFRTDDGRLTSADAQADILIAAAVAVATFTGGLVRNGDIDPRGLVATGALAVVVTMLALFARRERPGTFGRSKAEMDSTGSEAGRRVGECTTPSRTTPSAMPC